MVAEEVVGVERGPRGPSQAPRSVAGKAKRSCKKAESEIQIAAKGGLSLLKP